MANFAPEQLLTMFLVSSVLRAHEDVSYFLPLSHGGARKSCGHTPGGQLFPKFYFISATILRLTFPDMRNAISGVPSTLGICPSEMVIATP